MMLTDTILALSSPTSGPGLRAIIRISGPDAHRLACELVETDPNDLRRCVSEIDLHSWPAENRLAMLLRFHAPHSFTGQDIAELHLPNSPGLVRWAMDCLLETARVQGIRARLAEPGEFSARAFFNGKMDLTEAEGIAATINAQNEVQLRAAASLRHGDLHKWISEVAEQLANLLAMVEAGIDFVDEEDIRFITSAQLESRLIQLGEHIQENLALGARIDRLDDLPTVVFIGQPNVGKSSLINALAGYDRSIVSPIAGTTRDMLTTTMRTRHGDIRLVDVPGEEAPADELRAKMMEAREQALLDADMILEIVADSERAIASLAEHASFPARCITIQNKVDLLPGDMVRTIEAFNGGTPLQMRASWQMVSAKTGLHLGQLREAIGSLLSSKHVIAGDRLVLNHRHRAILQESHHAVTNAGCVAHDSFDSHPELIAAEMRRALDLLGQITGTISPDEVLGRIFSTFCIGK